MNPSLKPSSDGLLSEPAFRRRLEEEVARVRRYQSILCVLILGKSSEQTLDIVRDNIRVTDVIGTWAERQAIVVTESPKASGDFSERLLEMALAVLRLATYIKASGTYKGLGACLMPEDPSGRVSVEKLLQSALAAFDESQREHQPVIYKGAARFKDFVRPLQIPPPLEIGELQIHPSQKKVLLGTTPIPLIRKEFDLLLHLVKQAGKTVSRENIGLVVWGYQPDGDSRTVDMTIARLRKKLTHCASLRIATIKGEGYRLEQLD